LERGLLERGVGRFEPGEEACGWGLTSPPLPLLLLLLPLVSGMVLLLVVLLLARCCGCCGCCWGWCCEQG